MGERDQKSRNSWTATFQSVPIRPFAEKKPPSLSSSSFENPGTVNPNLRTAPRDPTGLTYGGNSAGTSPGLDGAAEPLRALAATEAGGSQDLACATLSRPPALLCRLQTPTPALPGDSRSHRAHLGPGTAARQGRAWVSPFEVSGVLPLHGGGGSGG